MRSCCSKALIRRIPLFLLYTGFTDEENSDIKMENEDNLGNELSAHFRCEAQALWGYLVIRGNMESWINV